MYGFIYKQNKPVSIGSKYTVVLSKYLKIFRNAIGL